MSKKNEPSALAAGQPQPLAEWFADGLRHGVAMKRAEWLAFVASQPPEQQPRLLRLVHHAPFLPPPPNCIPPPVKRLH